MRAHLATKHLASGSRSYLAAAARAAAVFNISSQEGGVRGEVLGRYPWYEEYPTAPSSHILNGFMYGLVGLQELASVQGEGRAEELYR